jgi:hypothetical protein
MVIGHAPLERQLHLGQFGAHATSGEVGEFGGVLFARQELRESGPPGDTEPVTAPRRAPALAVSWMVCQYPRAGPVSSEKHGMTPGTEVEWRGGPRGSRNWQGPWAATILGLTDGRSAAGGRSLQNY